MTVLTPSTARCAPAVGNNELLANPLAPKELGSTLLVIVGGGALALGLGRQLPSLPVGAAVIALGSPLRRLMLAAGAVLERTDEVLRRWPVAGLSLLALALLFVGLMETH